MKSAVPLYKEHATLYGVSGWLLLFCIEVTVLGPIINFSEILSMIRQSDPLLLVLTSILGIGPVVYGVVVGIMLWLLRPKAVKHARIYLLVFLCTNLLVAINSFLTELSSGSILLLLRIIVPFIVWWIYFQKSVRVKNTFDPQKQDKPIEQIVSTKEDSSDSH